MTNLIFEVAASGRHAGVCASGWVVVAQDSQRRFALSKLKGDTKTEIRGE